MSFRNDDDYDGYPVPLFEEYLWSVEEEDWYRGADYDGPIPKNICICKKCNMKNEHAEANQKDGSYICYNCR